MDLYAQYMAYGSIIMYCLMGKMQGDIFGVFVISVITLTFWEYIVGVFLEKVFKTKYWDYSEHKINFQGRICLTNSIAWGFLGVGFINFIHPFLMSCIKSIPQNVFQSIIYGSIAIMIVDTIISVIKVKSIKIKLKKIQEIEEEIKTKLDEIKETSKEKVPDKAKVTENVQIALQELKTKRNRMARKLYKYVYRLKSAFPAINTKEITQILNKKIKIPRKDSKEKRR